MPPRGVGPRLWPREERRDSSNRVTHPAVWLILDGSYQRSTRCGLDDRVGAERALAAYIARKQATPPKGARDPDHVPVASVIALYGRDVAPERKNQAEIKRRLTNLISFFGRRLLSEINRELCRAYVATRSTPASARRDLEDLRAAVNHYHREGHASAAPRVYLPARGRSRERWLTRAEAAKLIWSAWRYTERQLGSNTRRHTRRHVARFVVVALYTGTRAGAICSAALQPTEGRGWVDLKHGVFYRRPQGAAETKKRQPPIPLPRRLLAHMRRWKRAGQRYVVEWNGEPISRMAKAFRSTVRAAKLKGVTPHTLRHTAATWLMQAGVGTWPASGYLGMSRETLERVYAHHHPDYLKEARDAFDRPRPAKGSAKRMRVQRGIKKATAAKRKTVSSR